MTPTAHHVARIDTLRAAAALAVVVYHYYGGVFGRDALGWSGLLRDPATAPAPLFLWLYPLAFGWTGVGLFFVLSGYVIHRSFLNDPAFGWGKYAVRRLARICPPYLLVLVAYAVASRQVRSFTFAAHAALVHNLTAETFFGLVPAFWSVAVEVQLYALYPLVLLARRRFGIAGALWASAAVAVAWCAVAAGWYDWSAPLNYAPWWSPPALWPTWILGAWLAERHHAGRSGFGRPLLVAAGCGAAAVAASVFRPTYLVAAFTLAAVASAGLVDFVLRRPARSGGRPGWVARLFGVIGLSSYSLYLIHQPLVPEFLRVARGVSTDPAILMLAAPLFVAAVVLLAWGMYLTVERASIWLGRRLTSRKAK